ncbi:MAG: DUF805 domain-containing protein [Ascidiaceihabitans sp.]|jgi:uncharacterized membrane protein YhaH (DUF805 family)|nr:DUF805 domain-containing protein [Ascidiaceihabitans sp.]
MGFTDAVRTCLTEKYITFSGRASRSEYWWFALFSLLVTLVLVGLFFLFGGVRAMNTGQFSTINYIMGALFVVGMIALYIPYISVYVRRFHDRDLSGWWILGVFVLSNIPYLGVLISLAAFVITVLKGTDGENRFGEDPLNPSSGADVFA